MAFQPAPDTAEVTIDWLCSGRQTANVIHFIHPGGYSQANLDALALSVAGNVGAHLLPLLTSTQAFAGVRVKGLSIQNDLQAADTTGAGTGPGADEALPNNVSLCVTLKTAVTGRSARGRFYMQSPNVGNMAGPNTVLSAYHSSLVDALNVIYAGGTLNGWIWVVLSRFANGALRATAVTFPVTNILIRNNRTDSQRNRMPTPD